MQCNKCGREAVLFQAYSGQHLCRQHFETDLERKTKHEIRTHRWLEPGDHIAVALSGDANSSALLYFLKKLTSSRHDIRISAIIIDEGIMGYRDPVCANEIARASGAECIRISFPERFGMSIDEIAKRKGVTISCMYCRVLRNFLLDRIATEYGVTKLATGDDLDDSATSVLKTILRGNACMVARSGQTRKGKIPRIRPFISIPKNEVALYAALHIKEYDRSRCPYHNDLFDEDVRVLMEDFTIRHPATGYALLGLENHLTGTWCIHQQTVPSCERCGEPSDGICMNCRIIDEVTAGGS